jgi:hypothetical protein
MSADQEKTPEKGPRKFLFPSHQSHLLTLAKMCQDNKGSILQNSISAQNFSENFSSSNSGPTPAQKQHM